MLDKLDLVVEIEELLEECDNYPFGDNYGNYPYELIISPSVENQEFTIENFMLWQNFIEIADWNEFSTDVEIKITECENDYPEIAKQYLDFINFIEKKLQNVQIYKVKLEEIKEGEKRFDEAHINLIIGSAEDLWLGITPRIDNEYYYGAKSPIISSKQCPKADNIINRLKSEFKESFRLLGSSVEDYLIGEYKIETVDDRKLIIEKLLDSGCYCWKKDFKPNSRSKIGNKLGELLINNLSDVKQYKIWGYDGLFIYSGGIAENGDWIGLYTKQEYSY